ncbi:beta-ketoacyl synthase N-terminal-like domain-containing protein [Aquimarina sediminis]|uniref:beta-ketoacyl synthase N-terminal-like domain-containing protein n=1 Tax=Aquimarina sediminis TaxID=2070536 RepID=UPI000CA0715C|nr:beta-ketoacyl synthase N-terminal-like domain-containing protein [Aquimarina sediminis]
MNNSIAIIGISFELPNIKNWDELRESLYSKSSYIGEMPEHRLKEIHEAFGEIEMSRGGYLNEIDKFDNEHFGFTERESLRTFPEHRLFLTNAIKAFYNAGYNETSLKGTKTGVFYSAAKSVYHNYASISDVSFLDFDFVKGIEATRLAKYLDLRGPVVAISTSCSSSLVALNAARQSLNTNECDMAIVGGAKTLSLTKSGMDDNVVHSQKGECRPFDQEADGMVNGEGAVFFVLKRYEQAVKDGDAIFGEIKGAALNHGGNRISSLTAPSSEAQKDVILQAWDNAKIDIKKMRFIEAHGTGTILGDPIEVEGIKQAIYNLNPPPKETPFAMSSFKGQIGHLDFLSGLAGLLRLVAALNFKIIPVQANLNKLNDFFDLKDIGLYVPTSTEPWDSKENERVGGVSSYGLTGTNVHVVVSQNEAHITRLYEPKKINYLQISHKDERKFKLYKDYLIKKIEGIDNDNDVNRLCLKLNKIFQVDKENQAIIYSSKQSLISALKSKSNNPDHEIIFMLLDLDILEYSKESIKLILDENRFIKRQWDEYVALEIEDIQNAAALSTLVQYAIYKYLFDKFGAKIKLITTKEDSTINLLLKSKITVEQVINNSSVNEQKVKDFDEESFRKYLKNNLSFKEVVLIDFSKKEKNRFDDLNLNLKVIDGLLPDNDRFQLYSNILDSGVNPLMTSVTPIFNNIELPYFFPKRFWPEVKENPLADKLKRKEITRDDVRTIITKAWYSVLETNDINDKEDFFEIGGSSLLALEMIDEIEKNIEGVKIPYEDIYTQSTISKLEELVFLQLNNTSKHIVRKENTTPELDKTRVKSEIRNIWVSLLELEDFKDDDDFFDLGGSSLLALEMIDEIEKNSGIKIPYEDIYSCSTISKLLIKIFPETDDKTTNDKVVSKNDTKLRENQYSKLISDIKKENLVKEVPGKIFITGGTGLLGMAVIDYLMTNTNSILYCLIRKKESYSSEQRFWSIFENYYEVFDKERIHIIEGDLCLQNLGIKNLEKELPNIDMIFHIGGTPEYISKKRKEEHVNYLGTRNIVDLANLKKIKKLNFISTVSVAGKNESFDIDNFYETDFFTGRQTAGTIHSSSKIMAEKYILDNYNFNGKIFRISNIGGRYKDGFFSHDKNLNKNLMWSKLKILCELECYCKEILEEKSRISFFPVDVLSKVVSEISFTHTNHLNVYHILPERNFSNGEILTALKETGVSPKCVSSNEFNSYMKSNNYVLGTDNSNNIKNEFTFRNDATIETFLKLNFEKETNYDFLVYLKRLILANLKLPQDVIDSEL